MNDPGDDGPVLARWQLHLATGVSHGGGSGV